MAKQPVKHRRPPLRRPTSPGSPPGTLVAHADSPAPVIHVLCYGPDVYEEHEFRDTGRIGGQCREWQSRWPVTWVHVEGLGDAGVIQDLGECFGLHRLALEDVLHVQQRPKLDRYEDVLFIVTRMVERVEKTTTEQLCIFLGESYVISFEERPNSIMGVLRARLKSNHGLLRKRGPDMLAYALLDLALDSYFPVLEEFEGILEKIENDVMERPTSENLMRIYEFRRNLMRLRHDVWPQRDALNSLFHQAGVLMSDETRMYLRDCYDHAVQVYDLLEHYRELSGGLIDIHQSSLNNRMNDIMRVLTVIATLFMPLSFITGVYGMNFNTERSPLNMPELNWYWGYPFAIGLLAGTAALLIWFFRKKGWLRKPHPSDMKQR